MVHKRIRFVFGSYDFPCHWRIDFTVFTHMHASVYVVCPQRVSRIVGALLNTYSTPFFFFLAQANPWWHRHFFCCCAYKLCVPRWLIRFSLRRPSSVYFDPYMAAAQADPNYRMHQVCCRCHCGPFLVLQSKCVLSGRICFLLVLCLSSRYFEHTHPHAISFKTRISSILQSNCAHFNVCVLCGNYWRNRVE